MMSEESTRDIAAAVLSALAARGQTLATCESLTAGLTAATLAQVPGASAVLRGGLITYATDLKHTLAGVDAALLAERGAVDPEVAAQMAAGARTQCAAHWGLGLTGVAGPDPQDGKPVGTVFVACAGPDGAADVQALALSGSRDEIRRGAVAAALSLLRSRLENSPN